MIDPATSAGVTILISSFLLLLQRTKNLQRIQLLKEARMNVLPKACLTLLCKGKLFVSQGSVVTMAAHAIVNAANTGGLGGGGVDGAISTAGGAELRKAREALPVLDKKRTRIPTGEAKLTVGGALNADYCIHAVGPNYRVSMALGKTAKECDLLLYSAYKSAMQRAQEQKCETIGFSLLSAGIFRGTRTVKQVLTIGLNAIEENGYEGLKEVHMVGYTPTEIDVLVALVEEKGGTVFTGPNPRPNKRTQRPAQQAPLLSSVFTLLLLVVPLSASFLPPPTPTKRTPPPPVTATATPASPIGPYATQRHVFAAPLLDQSDPRIVVTFPSTDDTNSINETFPLIVYAHGMFGGGTDILGYAALFHQLASYGFVIAAPTSCSTGCVMPGGASNYTACGGLPFVEPYNKGWDSYYGESLKTIDWARNNATRLPINWTAGVGIAGHSMGGQSTTIASCEACTKKYGIRAAAIHHAANGALAHGESGNIGSNVSVPIAAFTSSGDGIWNETREIWQAVDGSRIHKMYRDVQGFSHLEPVLVPPIENPYLAKYTAAWFSIYLKGDTAQKYDLIYGNASDSICRQQEMVECVVGRPPLRR